MIVAIHQPNYIPWLGFFHKMSNSDLFVLLDDVKHSKSSVTHRNKIKSNEKELLLTVPLQNKEHLINELLIDKPEISLKKHWLSIETNYRKARYWSYLADELSSIYHSEWKYLKDLNVSLIKLFMRKLYIETEILLSSELPEIIGEGSERNLNICKKLGADVYLSGTGAKKYNNEEAFLNSNIKIVYNNFTHPDYPQMGLNFISHLSIIDLIFNCGDESKDILLKN